MNHCLPPGPKDRSEKTLKSLYGKRRHLKESNRLEILVPGMDRRALGATCTEDIAAAIYVYLFIIIVDMS